VAPDEPLGVRICEDTSVVAPAELWSKQLMEIALGHKLQAGQEPQQRDGPKRAVIRVDLVEAMVDHRCFVPVTVGGEHSLALYVPPYYTHSITITDYAE
jgi:hypothetical protein